MKARKTRPHKPNQTGRSDKTARFVMLPMRVLESAAYASLDLAGRAVLTELVALYNGRNNGSLYLSVADATARLGLSDTRAASRAFDDLEAVGLIELSKDAHFNVKTGEASRARCWRIPWEAWPENPNRAKRSPQFGWEQYEASGKRADRRLRVLAKFRKALVNGKFPDVDFTVTEPNVTYPKPQAVVESTPVKAKSHAKQPIVVGVKTPPYIDTTSGSWWQGEAESLLRGQYLCWALIARNNIAQPLAA